MRLGAWTRRLPWEIVLVAAALVALGLVGIARSESLSGGSGRHFYRQLFWAQLCAVAMLAASVANYRVLIRWSYPAFFVSLALLVAVFWFPPVNGSHRWIRFGPVGLQPSEFAKLAVRAGTGSVLDVSRQLPAAGAACSCRWRW